MDEIFNLNSILSDATSKDSTSRYFLACILIFLGPLSARILFRLLMEGYLRKLFATSTGENQVEKISSTSLRLLQGLIVYAGARLIDFPQVVQSVLGPALQLILIFFLVRILSLLTRYMLHRQSERTGAKVGHMRGLSIIADVILWPFAIVFFLNNQGYNVTAILTGLGIGGIAVALAAQNILIDMFNYFVIFLDKPFEIGDFIILDDKMGTVEYIGLKTTRVRALGGEQMVLSNSDLTKSRIHNYKRMEQRRISFWIKVPFSTPSNKLSDVPKILKNIIGDMAGLTFDRAHLLTIGEYSYHYEIVYIILSGDYNVYADVQQRINAMIISEFARHDIKFATPVFHPECACWATSSSENGELHTIH